MTKVDGNTKLLAPKFEKNYSQTEDLQKLIDYFSNTDKNFPLFSEGQGYNIHGDRSQTFMSNLFNALHTLGYIKNPENRSPQFIGNGLLKFQDKHQINQPESPSSRSLGNRFGPETCSLLVNDLKTLINK